MADLAPRIRALVPDFTTIIIGAASAADIASRSDGGGTRLTGYVPDIRPVMKEATCALVPLRTGGGTRVKILTAWAMGLPVVTTSVGCEGLEFRDGVHGFIRDDAAGFAQAAADLLQRPALARDLGRQARDHVVSRYSWPALLGGLRDAYTGLIGA